MQLAEPEVSAGTAQHPLDPLSEGEIRTAAEILKRERSLASSARFVFISLREPAKSTVLGWTTGQPIERRAFVVIRERAEKRTYEAIVNLTTGQVESWEHIPGRQAQIMFEEFFLAEEVVKKDPRFREALARRGVTDFDNVMVDAWSLGYNGLEEHPDRGRFVRPLTWVKNGPTDHGYARPVEGLITVVDLDTGEVVSVEDHGVVPLPRYDGNYDPERIKDPNNYPHFPDGVRKDLKPIEITQPEGRSFQVNGWEVTWQKWNFRVGWHPREGLILHCIQYHDQGRWRPIIYRASISEMFIPYGDPAPTHRRKNVFDMGEYGIGVLANSLTLGCDCLGDIHYFDGWVNDNDGNPMLIKNAICMHEEDYGILWKHTDWRTGSVEVRRSRRLVVSMICTVGNYEYGFFWYLYPDGNIEHEVKLTGVISNGVVPDGVTPKHGVMVAPNLYGPHHQHYFCARLDMMVDGLENTVQQIDSVPLPPGPDNPYGNAWVTQATAFTSEKTASSVVNPQTARYWKVINPNRTNMVGDPVGYKLMPGDNCFPMYQPDAHAIKRAQFCTKHVWVTRYDPAELYPAGDYPNQHPGGDGITRWIEQDRGVENTDVVLWYNFGAHHVVRPEDWPVMPVAYIGFMLKPVGFFDGNPSLDMPPSAACHLEGHDEHNGHHA